MSLSTCKCGGHIPLGPNATNRCEDCGKSVFGDPFVASSSKDEYQALVADRDRFRAPADELAEALESVGTSLMLSSVVHPSYSGPWISEINAALAKYHAASTEEKP